MRTTLLRPTICFALMLGAVRSEAAAPVVTNVHALQRADESKKVDIWYDLADSDSPTVRVSLEVYYEVPQPGGGTVEVPIPAQTLVGSGFGASVPPGNGRRIEWNAGADWNGQWSDRVKFRVIANDDMVPANMALIPAGNYQMGNALSASGDGYTDELLVHTVYVSAFYMDRYEVTKQL